MVGMRLLASVSQMSNRKADRFSDNKTLLTARFRSPSDQSPRLQSSGSPISTCPTVIEDPLGDQKTICEFVSEVQWSSDSYNYHQDLVSFVASMPGRQLSIRPGHGQNSRFKAFRKLLVPST